MLFDMLQRKVQKIRKMGGKKPDAGVFAEQVRRNNPGQPGPDKALAGIAIAVIQSIPKLVADLSDELEGSDLPPALRTTILSGFAYLVNPDDIIPDGAPASYGLVDDCAVLAGIAREVAKSKGLGDPQRQYEACVNLMLQCAPAEKRPLIEGAVCTLALLPQLLEGCSPDLIDAMNQAIVADPMAATAGGAGIPGPAAPDLRRPEEWFSSVPGGGTAWSNGRDYSIHSSSGSAILIDGKLTVI